MQNYTLNKSKANEFDVERDDKFLKAIDWTPEVGYGSAPKRGIYPRRGAGY